jgi:phage tail sheath protein FI
MPEYLAPGVYVEETSFRSKSIEGVSTTTTGLIGPCRYGPVDLENELLTSLAEFELAFGDRVQLRFGDSVLHNYLWHGVRAFFTEGGKRLYVSRVFKRLDDTDPDEPRAPGFDPDAELDGELWGDGVARELYPAGASADDAVFLRARYPGTYGNARVRLTFKVGQNVLSSSAGAVKVTGAVLPRDVVLVRRNSGSTVTDRSGAYLASFNAELRRWEFSDPDASPAVTLSTADLAEHELRPLSLMVIVEQGDSSFVWDGLALDPAHARDGALDSLASTFSFDASRPELKRGMPIVLTLGANLATGLDVLNALAASGSALRTALADPRSSDAARSIDVLLKGGNDGQRPSAGEYEGGVDEATMRKKGLAQFEDIEDISIVAAPGSTFGLENGYRNDGSTIINLLISHAARMRYRIAVLDSGDGQSLAQVRALRARIDSSYAALYYPWVRVLDPVTREPIMLPPSGFVTGIYARNDTTRAVYKAPANEVVNLALGFETLLNKAQQDVLNPEGINAFRFFEGRGYRLWGARTVSSDPEWKYVNVRRYFAYLERSIDKGTQWAVFEPNGEQLWANVRRTIEDFLLNEWQMGALLGDKPEKAFFVRCDRSTMTQNDLDNGRLICLIGVAPLKPAEFVIFRIGQWTADRKS